VHPQQRQGLSVVTDVITLMVSQSHWQIQQAKYQCLLAICCNRCTNLSCIISWMMALILHKRLP